MILYIMFYKLIITFVKDKNKKIMTMYYIYINILHTIIYIIIR